VHESKRREVLKMIPCRYNVERQITDPDSHP
jgi:hypothetical protein